MNGYLIPVVCLNGQIHHFAYCMAKVLVDVVNGCQFSPEDGKATRTVMKTGLTEKEEKEGVHSFLKQRFTAERAKSGGRFVKQAEDEVAEAALAHMAEIGWFDPNFHSIGKPQPPTVKVFCKNLVAFFDRDPDLLGLRTKALKRYQFDSKAEVQGDTEPAAILLAIAMLEAPKIINMPLFSAVASASATSASSSTASAATGAAIAATTTQVHPRVTSAADNPVQGLGLASPAVLLVASVDANSHSSMPMPLPAVTIFSSIATPVLSPALHDATTGTAHAVLVPSTVV